MSERRNIIMPPDWWRAVESARGPLSLSEFVRRAVSKALPADVRRELSEPKPVGKPPKGPESPEPTLQNAPGRAPMVPDVL